MRPRVVTPNQVHTRCPAKNKGYGVRGATGCEYGRDQARGGPGDDEGDDVSIQRAILLSLHPAPSRRAAIAVETEDNKVLLALELGWEGQEIYDLVSVLTMGLFSIQGSGEHEIGHQLTRLVTVVSTIMSRVFARTISATTPGLEAAQL
ncbi:MAG: hypothetical protein WDW38_004806 [Sanguina aurantia]